MSSENQTPTFKKLHSLTVQELSYFAAYAHQALHGAQLQEVITKDHVLALGFWLRGRIWLVLDLNSHMPLPLIFSEDLPFVGGKPKPVQFFLKSHGVDRRLSEIRAEERERVLHIRLGLEPEATELEVRLFPKGANLIVRAGDKQISLAPVMELTEPPQVDMSAENIDWHEMAQAWTHNRHKPKGAEIDPQLAWEKDRQKQIQKKNQALQKMLGDLHEKQNAPWAQLGEWLKANQSLSVPQEWRELIDPRQSISANMQKAFEKAKDLKKKIDGTQARIEVIKKEVASLEAAAYRVPSIKQTLAKEKAFRKDLLREAGVKGRRLPLTDKTEAVFGKSAAENMALLRKAQSWDLWLHLRDFPGSHAFVRRPRNHHVGDDDLRKVAEWLIKESLGLRASPAEKYAIVMTECRHVKPIKGDKLGRVTYHHERHFVVQLR